MDKEVWYISSHGVSHSTVQKQLCNIKINNQLLVFYTNKECLLFVVCIHDMYLIE